MGRKSEKRIELGEEEWKSYQIDRNREKAREYQRRIRGKSGLFFNGRKIKDITGYKSGMLTAIRPVPPEEYGRTDVKSVYWECQCECGGTIITRTLRITGGEYKSCGCQRINGKANRLHNLREDAALRNDFFGEIPVRHFHEIESKAKRRKILFSVGIEYLDEIFKKQGGKCVFTGENLEFKLGKDRNKTTASLDRINSYLGYIKGNLQWVHKDANMLKGKMRDESLRFFCEKYADIILKIRDFSYLKKE